jgi:hypothetical protein
MFKMPLGTGSQDNTHSHIKLLFLSKIRLKNKPALVYLLFVLHLDTPYFLLPRRNITSEHKFQFSLVTSVSPTRRQELRPLLPWMNEGVDRLMMKSGGLRLCEMKCNTQKRRSSEDSNASFRFKTTWVITSDRHM